MASSDSADYSDSDNASSTPSSDPDPYSMSTTRQIFSHASATALPPHIDADALPRGLPLLGPFTGYSAARRVRTINARLASISSMIHRPLSVPEEQAVAWHTAKGLAIGSWGPSIGIAFGLGQWWRTREEMRWLWVGRLKDEGVNRSWKEYHERQAAAAAGTAAAEEGAEGAAEGAAKKPPSSVRWDGGRLWVGDRELMRGWNPLRREAVLQGFRALPYVGLGWFVAAIVVSGYATTVTAVGEMKDARLGGLERELKNEVQKTMKRKPGSVPGVAGGVGRERRDPTGQGTRTPSELWKTHREEIESVDRGPEVDDDASPTGGDGFFGETDAKDSTRRSSPSEPRRQRGFQRTKPQDEFQSTDRQAGFEQDRYERSSRKGEDSFDDASPTGGAGAIGSDDSSSGSSVWERIRNQSASGSSSEPSSSGGRRTQRGGGIQQRQPQQKQRNEDSFSFSSSEEERQYAKDEAQKEFDARVEKEREGGDFSGGNDRKW